jgi:hypothetical protein
MRYPSPTRDIGILFFQAFQAGNDLFYRTPWDNSILLYSRLQKNRADPLQGNNHQSIFRQRDLTTVINS